MEPFGSVYAGVYDRLYRDKDYAGECDMLERVFAGFSESPVHSILDLGCGTGGHALLLAKRGYRVVGVDRSQPMLAQARAKAAILPASVVAPTFVHGDLKSFAVEDVFNAAVLMFNVLGYQLETTQVVEVLRNATRHLNSGGVLVCDYWHGPAVINAPPDRREKIVGDGSDRLTRIAEPRLDAHRRHCDITFRLAHGVGVPATDKSSEHHKVRFFFPLELAQLFDEAGLELIHIGKFPDFETPPRDDGPYAVIAVGRRLAIND